MRRTIVITKKSDSQLQAELDQANADKAALQLQINGLNADKAALQSQINGLNGAIATLNSQIASLNSQLATANATISSKDSEIASLNSQLATANATISDKNTQIANLNSQIATKDSQIANLNQQIANLNQQIADLTNQLATANGQITSLNQQVATNNATIQKLNTLCTGTLTTVQNTAFTRHDNDVITQGAKPPSGFVREKHTVKIYCNVPSGAQCVRFIEVNWSSTWRAWNASGWSTALSLSVLPFDLNGLGRSIENYVLESDGVTLTFSYRRGSGDSGNFLRVQNITFGSAL